MRPSRLLILGFAGLCALHVYMLAGHGRSHDPAMAAPGMGEHPRAPAVLELAPAMPGDHDAAGFNMTVACLAVLAGLLLLPGWRRQPATAEPHRRTFIQASARPERADPRTRSLAELCISLT
jgi:hypothetical protein